MLVLRVSARRGGEFVTQAREQVADGLRTRHATASALAVFSMTFLSHPSCSISALRGSGVEAATVPVPRRRAASCIVSSPSPGVCAPQRDEDPRRVAAAADTAVFFRCRRLVARVEARLKMWHLTRRRQMRFRPVQFLAHIRHRDGY